MFLEKIIYFPKNLSRGNKSAAEKRKSHNKKDGGSKFFNWRDSTATDTTESLDSSSQHYSLQDHSSITSGIQETAAAAPQYENAVFRNELLAVMNDRNVTKVTLCNFIDRYQRDDMVCLANIIRLDARQFRIIKFEDTVDGANFRRWQFKKSNLQRMMCQAAKANRVVAPDDMTGGKRRLPVTFEARLEMDMDHFAALARDVNSQAAQTALASLLDAVQKDRSIKGIVVNGSVRNHMRFSKQLMTGLLELLTCDDRKWMGVLLNLTTPLNLKGGDDLDYEHLDRNVRAAQKHLIQVGMGPNGTGRVVPISIQQVSL